MRKTVMKDLRCRCGGEIEILHENNLITGGCCLNCKKNKKLPKEDATRFLKRESKPSNGPKRILECSTLGDKRFSALTAKVTVNGIQETIEYHYQTAKVFADAAGAFYQVTNWKDAKGKIPIAFCVNGYYLPIRFGVQYYGLLWYRYLKAHPELVEILAQYDQYNDLFASKQSICSQANAITAYMQDNEGNPYSPNLRGNALKAQSQPLLNILSHQDPIILESGNLLHSYAQVLAHQVNAQGVMGAGLAKQIKAAYPEAYRRYRSHSLLKTTRVLGECQWVETEAKVIANLFGQLNYGRAAGVCYTDYQALREALLALKNLAKAKGLTVALPHGLGCGLAGGDWDGVVLPLIQEVFSDYYVLVVQQPKPKDRPSKPEA